MFFTGGYDQWNLKKLIFIKFKKKHFSLKIELFVFTIIFIKIKNSKTKKNKVNLYIKW